MTVKLMIIAVTCKVHNAALKVLFFSKIFNFRCQVSAKGAISIADQVHTENIKTLSCGKIDPRR